MFTASQEEACPAPPVTTFVDDQYIIPSTPTLNLTNTLAQTSVDRAEAYMISNKLKLNIPKTILMTISPTVGDAVTISSSNQQVLSTPYVKALGITIQSDLKWDIQVRQCLANLAFKTTILRKIRPLASFRTMKLIATSLIIGKITYGIQLYGHLNQGLQQKFQTALLTAARACLGPHHQRDSATKLLDAMGWLSFPQLVDQYSARLVHQVLTTKVPEGLHSKFGPPQAGNTRSAQNLNIQLPTRRAGWAKLSFTHQGTVAYNAIHVSIKRIGRSRPFSKHVTETIKRTKQKAVPRYHLRNLAPPPSCTASRTDLTFVLQPNGSWDRNVIPIRTYTNKPLVLADRVPHLPAPD